MNLKKIIKNILKEEFENSQEVVCKNCGWSWKLSDGGNDPYVCHKCGNDNSKKKKKDFEPILRKLINHFLEKNPNKKYVCGYEIGLGKFATKHTGERYQRYKVTLLFNSGYGSKNWPMTQAVLYREEAIMKELRSFINNLLGIIIDTYSKSTPNCENEDTEKSEQTESELTEKCWKGYTQKGMKTMFGKRYPNCVKKTKK